MTKTYEVTAKRWARGWELHIAGVGVTQSHGLYDAERMVRDYIELDLGSHNFDVVVTAELDRKVDARIRAARKATADAAEAVEAAARRSREVARELKEAGLTGRDIAVVLGVSAQRVSQLLASSPKANREPRAATRKTISGVLPPSTGSQRRNSRSASKALAPRAKPKAGAR